MLKCVSVGCFLSTLHRVGGAKCVWVLFSTFVTIVILSHNNIDLRLVSNIADTCSVKPEDRNDCGWLGIDRKNCEDRGCCYNDSVKGAKFCFYPTGWYTVNIRKKSLNGSPWRFPRPCAFGIMSIQSLSGSSKGILFCRAVHLGECTLIELWLYYLLCLPWHVSLELFKISFVMLP